MERKIHICLLYDYVPNPDSGGGALTVYSFSKALKELGVELTALLLMDRAKMSDKDSKRLSRFREMADNVFFVGKGEKKENFLSKIKNKFSFSPASAFPKETSVKERVKEKVNEISPDVVFIYHFEALAASTGIENFPKMTIVGDPPFSVTRERFSFFLKNWNFKYLLLVPFYPFLYLKYKKITVQLMNSCHLKGAFASHHAEELEKLGVESCKYYPSPIIDARKEIVGKMPFSFPSSPFKILMLGHLKGISSITGVALFADKILPRLVKELGKENFEVNVVGAYFDTLPDKLKKKLEKEPVKKKGFLDSVAGEFLASDIFLVPTPIKLGIRLRIITAMAFGSCVVAHSANKSGIPELKDGENCLLGDSGEEIAQKLIDCHRGKYDLAKIRENARKTYETYFEPKRASGRILSDMKKLCSAK